ncbi:hypothetical protein PBI_COLTRANE_64 [Microbacterium phage Coltrane]|uniref:Uncharacterized protein n=4 Tax=Armstrongvirus armstrong TaxID=2734217 RepID=A0A3G2KDM7_9CAUD|nr:hypothetical protein PBI_BRAHMS_64 [Microbacterium phage Brahms]AYN57041.1 hypothetical protein PBI_BERNSTEIN_64 [Microbacterium phage Bernstein]AYN57400.1 hypothetical protein PBI_COLTRANE_64 [Microbacterium phage Coltrane]AYN58988.1 hypothetical protein PBI_ROLLINS_64 [Microbacterium phage Rollins]UGL62031.1 hypothetical protein SEA_SKYLORD_64 [Microbacterium phage Skylord]
MTTNKKEPTVAISNKKTPASLVEVLASKANQLESTATTKTSQSNALALQAAEAAEVATIARAHAEAIDKALDILSEAGVTV